MANLRETSDSSSLSDNARPSTSAIREPDREGDSTSTEDYVDIETLNATLLELGESPINKRKLPQKKYSGDKFQKLQKTLASKVFHVEEEIEEEIQGAESSVIEKLKEGFAGTNNRNKKIAILTIFSHWSFSKIQQNFDASNRMIAVAKKTTARFGILSTPDGKSGKKLNQATKDCIMNFYTSDHMSRIMAGKKNYVTVKENGEKIQKQKRLILSNLKESYRAFKEKYPDLKVGFSKFCELRPKHCVLPGANGTHSVCVCAIHENVKLLLDGARIAHLTANTPQPVNNYKDCLARMLCNPPSTDCHLRQCSNFPGTEGLINQLEEVFETEFIDTVVYKQWTSVDRTNLETIQSTVEDLLLKLQTKLEALVTHSFIAQQQSAYFAEKKEQLQPGECLVVCDFAENYAFVIQDAIQGVHWNNDQVTLHPSYSILSI